MPVVQYPGLIVAMTQSALTIAKFKVDHDIVLPADLVAIPKHLADDFHRDMQKHLSDEPRDGLQLLNERHAKWITTHRVEIYTNENQHRGRPHCAVTLQDGKVSVSLDDPPAILTPKGIRGDPPVDMPSIIGQSCSTLLHDGSTAVRFSVSKLRIRTTGVMECSGAPAGYRHPSISAALWQDKSYLHSVTARNLR